MQCRLILRFNCFMSTDRGDGIESEGMLGLPRHYGQPTNRICIHICRKLLHVCLVDNEGLFKADIKG